MRHCNDLSGLRVSGGYRSHINKDLYLRPDSAVCSTGFIMNEEIGKRFQQETKYDPDELKERSLKGLRQPERVRAFEAPLGITQLPDPDIEKLKKPLWELLLKRRSRRIFNENEPLSINLLSVVLWATQGITDRYGDTFFRTAPSAGALFPVETYLMIREVDGIEHGLYHFDARAFQLELLSRGDYSKDLALAALSQAMVTKAQVTFLWTAVVGRSKWKYRQRAYRYIYLEAGHIAENLYLACEALGLGTCAIGAFFDDWVNSIIGVDGIEETIIYMATVGSPKKKQD
ncbi:nitroreductase family protein [bacterium BMS3Abin08]|nr:nitroreductase family protein [bacterium BMS3Abin08]